MGRRTAPQRLAAFVAELTYDALPRDVRAKTTVCVLDGIANALGGHDYPWTVLARRTASSLVAAGPSTLWGTARTSTPAAATFANAVAAHSVFHEDMHMESQSHFGTMAVPAAASARPSSAITSTAAAIGRAGRSGPSPPPSLSRSSSACRPTRWPTRSGWRRTSGPEIFNVYRKSAPACAYAQSVIQATRRLVHRARPAPEDIETVTVQTFPLGKTCPGLDNPGPFEEIIRTQMSNQFLVAAVLLDGDVSLDHYLDCRSERIAALASRVHVTIDDRATRVFPKCKGGGVRVRLKGGRVEQEWVDDLVYPTDADVEQKFHTYARRALPASRADELCATILGLESTKNCAALGALLRKA